MRRVCVIAALVLMAALAIPAIASDVAPYDGFSYHAKGYVLYSYFTEIHGKDLPVDQSLANDFSWYGFGSRDQLLSIAKTGDFDSWPAKSVALDPQNGRVTIKTLSMGVPEVIRNTEEGSAGIAIPTQFVDSFVRFPDGQMKHYGAVKYYKENGADQPKFITVVSV